MKTALFLVSISTFALFGFNPSSFAILGGNEGNPGAVERMSGDKQSDTDIKKESQPGGVEHSIDGDVKGLNAEAVEPSKTTAQDPGHFHGVPVNDSQATSSGKMGEGEKAAAKLKCETDLSLKGSEQCKEFEAVRINMDHLEVAPTAEIEILKAAPTATPDTSGTISGPDTSPPSGEP